MKSHLIRVLLSICMALFPILGFSQLPYSPCTPTGGKKANILGVETKYRAPGGGPQTFTIPAGTKSIVVFASSETGDLTPGAEPEKGDEDFITINAIIDIPSSTSSGFLNYAKSTFTNGSGTNVYGWRDVILGGQIPDGSKLGDKTPDLNNVNFSISGSTLTITENATGTHSSYYVEYLSPATNSFEPLPTEIRAILHGTTALNTDLVIPIPAGASLLTISGKGINSSNADLNSPNGSEEGYSNLRVTIDLDAGLTNGFVTLANGGTVDRRSTYVISNLSSTATSDMVSSGAITGDYTAKNTNTGAVGLYNPQIYVSGSNLIIRRDAAYARDFDDAYTIEFYKRVGQGMSAEFIDNDIRSIPASSYPAAGVTRTFKIPTGTHFIYFNETANAINLSLESNENSLAAYGYIDLLNETATGYYYQMVGSNLGTGRREDNYAFKDVPLDSTSTHDHINTVGFRANAPVGTSYDLRFTLSKDKSELIVTNQTRLANQTYQFLLSADFFGARPDLAFNPPNITFSKGTSCKQLKVTVDVCNPGAGNATGGMPISFYNGDPTVNPAAVLIRIDTLREPIKAGECKTFTFDLDLSSISDPTIDLTMVLNDEGTFVVGGVGKPVGTPFALSALDGRNPYYRECYYDNNLFTKTINVNSCPVIDPDPDKSSGATGNYSYLNYFTAGSTSPAKIADADLTIIAPGTSDIHGATITLTNLLDAGQEGIYLTGTLPAGITISGEGTGVVTLSGQASQADYIAAIKMLGYKNTNNTPNITDRIITTTLSDGTESGLTATTTIRILTNPGIDVTGNSIIIPDNSTTSNTADGTDFGQTIGATIAHSFTVHNSGTGVLTLTGTPLVSISGDPGFTVTTQPASSSLNGGANTNFEITFNPAGHSAGIYFATITIKNSDANADKADYTFVVSVATNRLPTVTNGTVSGDEDNTLVFSDTDFTSLYTDADASPLNKIRVLSLPQHGTLMLNGSPITAGQEIPAADLGNITFVPDANWNGSTSFDWVASDGMGYAATPATMTINIIPVNDAPVAAVPAGATVTEETATPIPGISFSDIDAGVGIVTVTISVPSGGFSATSGGGVTVSGTPGALVLEGTITDINAFIAANNLNYTSVHNPPASVTVTVNISDNGNTGTGGALQDTKTFPIQITSVNTPPTGTGDTKVTTRDIPVSGAVSGTDPDGDALTFSKGTDPAHGTVVVNTDGTYTYTPAAGYTGADNFTIVISDGQGGTVTVTVDITVNAPPNNPPTGTGDTKVTNQDTPVNGSVSGTDPDGDALTFTKDTDPAHGTVVVNTDGTYTYTPAAGYTGTDNFTILISDGNGGTVTVTINITVNPVIPTNNPPTGTGDTKVTTRDTPVSGAVTGTDPDGDVLTFTKGTDPAHGTVVVNTDGTYAYTPAAGYTGTDNFTITITDGKGGTATVTVDITVNVPPNNPPTGTGDTKTTNQDTPVSGSVSGTDPDGDAMTFTKGTDPTHGTVVVNTDGTYTYTPAAGYTGTDNFTITISDGKGGTATVTVNITVNAVLPANRPPTGIGDTRVTTVDIPVDGAVSGTDPDGDVLTYSIGTDPSNGSIIFSSDGTYTYTPNPGYIGPDSFTAIVSDGRGGTAVVTVNITVNPVALPNNPPIGTGDSRTTTRDIPVNGIVSGLDPDGDALTFTKGADPLHGTVVVNTDGTYTYTPAASYTGTDNFTVNISDGKGGTVTVTVNITVNPVVAPGNNPPTGTGDIKVTDQDTPVNGAVSGTDPDGDALTFTKGTDPAHGTVVVNTDGTYTYTPAAGYSGTDNFTITISDGKGGTTTVTVNITVNPVVPANNPPTGTGDAKTTEQDTPVNGAVAGTDPDGDALTFTKGTDPAHGTVVVNPDGTYIYTPAAGYSGADNFTIIISDGKGGTTTVTVNITVTVKTTTPPVAADDRAETRANIPVSVEVLANDIAGSSSLDEASVEIVNQPAHGTVVVNEDGTVVYTPDAGYTGEDVFSYNVANANGQISNTATVRITITLSTINVPNLFTPNGDGKNDNFEIRGLNQYYENELVIVNRWGNEVYRQKGYQNTWKGEGLNEGTYYYLLRIRRNATAEWEVMKGYVTLIRSFKQ